MNSLKRIVAWVIVSSVLMVSWIANDYRLLDKRTQWTPICVIQDKSLLLLGQADSLPTVVIQNGIEKCIVYK